MVERTRLKAQYILKKIPKKITKNQQNSLESYIYSLIIIVAVFARVEKGSGEGYWGVGSMGRAAQDACFFFKARLPHQTAQCYSSTAFPGQVAGKGEEKKKKSILSEQQTVYNNTREKKKPPRELICLSTITRLSGAHLSEGNDWQWESSTSGN